MFDIPVKKVEIFEVGPRDGLQNEKEFIPTEKKLELIRLLRDAGCARIELTSFVHPKWVPQMADALEIIDHVDLSDGAEYNALIPNMKGFLRALETPLTQVVTIMSASESHNTKNLNMSVAESLEQMREINRIAREHNVKVRSYIGTAYGCPMEGNVPFEKVKDIALALEEAGSYEISLGDTTGMASPDQSFDIAYDLLKHLKHARLAVHFHQARGIEFANILASLQAGITIFDSAAGGLGGCPYAPGATGNIATETLVEMFDSMGIDTGIDREKIRKAAFYATSLSAYHRGTCS
ncbi:MAG: hydroxymethylglutaryl-CoA lyase [Sphaerochaetaceae bacterium]|jgi:hydroxymethylglutaryl-CoA lyase|nr:hydroxymethylglutaryl-CoA lyase [Sphaerochaetaceae bacterium]MDX9809004.1 hydroxymethylglutaryl-CoA lyase [Sphaerochaetaceae bacterium]NLV85240.1 hydroxymethylglutaryl-CoA lyase [Spirochaetales bacterium]